MLVQMVRRAALLAASQFALGCHSDEQACPPVLESPKKEVAQVAPPKPQPMLAGTLTFSSPRGQKKVLSLQEIQGEFPLSEVTSEDPNYGGPKSFFALPLAPLLRKHLSPQEGDRLLLVASDGYSVEVEALLLLSDDAFLAVGDKAPGQFAPIGERKVNPGPSYLVWRGPGHADEKRYPRPWSLTTIEILDTSDRYEHTRPEAGFGENDAAKQGYSIFSASCIRCHAINREGGTLGPDLNVPQNVLSYRPEEQVRAYIRDPKTFRYSSMPAHPGLADEDIDALIAYLRLMGENQNDPDAN